MSAAKPPPKDTAYNRSKDIRRNLLTSSTTQTANLPSYLNVTDVISARVRELKQFNTSTTTATGTKRLYQCLVRHKRRRAMSHNVKLIPKTLREAGFREMVKHLEAGGQPPSKKVHRNIRRSKKLVLLNKIFRAKKHQWLEIHHFLSKRTKMANQWGFRLPIYTNDKCDRSVEKLQNVKCTFSDESYYSPIEITANTTALSWLLVLMNNYCNTYVEQLDAMRANRVQTPPISAQSQPSTSHTQPQDSSQLIPPQSQLKHNSQLSLSTTPHPFSSHLTSNKYALERLKTALFNAASLEVQQGKCEFTQILRYPSYSSLLFAASRQFPHLSTQQVESAMVETLSWVDQTAPKISSLSNTIVAPVRIQWLPKSTSRFQPLLSTCWIWSHPSSIQLTHNMCTEVLNFFTSLYNRSNSTSIVYPHVATILSNQFSRYSIRGPKSTLILSRILQLHDSTVKTGEFNASSDVSRNHAISTRSTISSDLDTTNSMSDRSNPTSITDVDYNSAQTTIPQDQQQAQLHDHQIWDKLVQLQTAPTNLVRSDTILVLQVQNFHSSFNSQRNAQTNHKTQAISTTSTKLLAKTDKYSVEKSLCPIGAFTFNSSRVPSVSAAQVSTDKVQNTSQRQTQLSNCSNPAPFFPAGSGATALIQSGQKVNNTPISTNTTTIAQSASFIPATWTHSSSTSHPNRYTPPIEQKTQLRGDSGEIQTTTDHNAKTKPTDHATNNRTLISIYSPLDRAKLIESSPGNASVLNCLRRRNISIHGDHSDASITNTNTKTSTSKKSPQTSAQAQAQVQVQSAPILPYTQIILIIRGQAVNSTVVTSHKDYPSTTQHSNSHSSLSTSTNQTTPNMQTGFDIILPKGWGRSFALKCLKEGGAVLVGKNQRNVLQIESGSFSDAFPHPATFPNSFAVQNVLKLKRMTKIVELFRKKRRNGHVMTRFGLLGANYAALFNKTKMNDIDTKSSNSVNFTKENTISPSTSAKTRSSTPTNHENVLNLTQPQYLDLMYKVRFWLSKLVRFARSKQRKERRKRRAMIYPPPRTYPAKSAKKQRLVGETVGTGETTKTLKVPSKPDRFPCPIIPFLSTFNSTQLPASDVESYKHASTKRTLRFLLNHTNLSGAEKAKITHLLSSPFSPLFVPPITWLHKRTYQAQALLKPLLPLTVAQRRAKLQKLLNIQNSTSTSTSITDPPRSIKKHPIGSIVADSGVNQINSDQSDPNNVHKTVGLLLRESKLDKSFTKAQNQSNPYDVIDLCEFNTGLVAKINEINRDPSMNDDAGSNPQQSTQKLLTSFNPTQFNVVNQIIYQFPILLNTIVPNATTLAQFFFAFKSDFKHPPQSPFFAFLSTTFPTLLTCSQPHDVKLSLLSTITLYSVLHSYISANLHSNLLIPLRLDQLSKGQIVSMQKTDRNGVSGETGVLTSPTLSDLSIISSSLRSKTSLSKHLQQRQQESGANNDTTDLPTPTPLGYTTFSHISIKSGYPYALAFITAPGLCELLEHMLRMHKMVPTLNQIGQVLTFLQQSTSPMPFSIASVVFPVAVYTEHNKKLAWGKVNAF